VLFALVHLVLRRLFSFAGGSASQSHSKDVEILVLRHQLKVLRRQAGRPRLRWVDRVVLAAASRAIPRPAWSSFLVSPQTLLRWHRELVRRKWTYNRKRACGRPPLDSDTRELILDSGGRTARGAASGSRASWPSSASGSPQPRSVPSSVERASDLRRGGPGRRGRSSCAPRHEACWPATPSRWRPCS
jgi:hypothetical protein